MNLSHNYITVLSGYIFKELKKLETIDISYNLIYQIESDSFYSLSALKRFYLLNLQQSTILSVDFVFQCRSLKWVYISSIDMITHNLEALTKSLRAVDANKVVNEAVYYESINVVLLDNFEYYASNRTLACELTIRLLKNKIHFNLFSDFHVDMFFSNCYSQDLFENNQ